MPVDARPQPLTVGGPEAAGTFRCPRGARITPPGSPGDHFCSICDCGRRTDTSPTPTT